MQLLILSIVFCSEVLKEAFMPGLQDPPSPQVGASEHLSLHIYVWGIFSLGSYGPMGICTSSLLLGEVGFKYTFILL